MFAFELALGRDDRFHEFAFGRVLEFEVETFHLSAAEIELAAELDVELCVTGEAFEIIEDDDEVLVRLGVDEGQKRHHAGPLHKIAAPRDIVWKHRRHSVTAGIGILAAAVLLTFEARARGLLLCRRDAAIDDRALGCVVLMDGEG